MLGFTSQKPITGAYEQRPEAVKAWLDQQYPAIAKLEGAEIHWGDETAVVNTDVCGRGYQPKAQTPVAYAVGGTRHKLSMIVDDAFNSDKFIEFLRALIKNADKKVFLILDNLCGCITASLWRRGWPSTGSRSRRLPSQLQPRSEP